MNLLRLITLNLQCTFCVVMQINRKKRKLQEAMKEIHTTRKKRQMNEQHAEIIKMVFALYVHVLKRRPNKKLNSTVLEGLAK